MKSTEPKTRLEQFVETRGIGTVAGALGVGIYSVYHYLRGSRHLRARRRASLLELAGDELTGNDIDAHFRAKSDAQLATPQ